MLPVNMACNKSTEVVRRQASEEIGKRGKKQETTYYFPHLLSSWSMQKRVFFGCKPREFPLRQTQSSSLSTKVLSTAKRKKINLSSDRSELQGYSQGIVLINKTRSVNLQYKKQFLACCIKYSRRSQFIFNLMNASGNSRIKDVIMTIESSNSVFCFTPKLTNHSANFFFCSFLNQLKLVTIQQMKGKVKVLNTCSKFEEMSRTISTTLVSF